MKPQEKNFIATQVVGKIQMEPDFFSEFQTNPSAAVKKVSEEIGKDLDDKEIKEIETEIKKGLPVAFLKNPEMRMLIEDITKRVNDGYEKVQWMSEVLFKLGIGVIISVFFIDVYGIFKQVNWQLLIVSSGVLGGDWDSYYL
jgi:sulfur relay (sulfurtransferase) DsrC/TusE family protein